MPRMWISNLTLAKVGKRLQALAKVVDENGLALSDAVVTIAIKRPLADGFPGGVYRDYTTSAQGIVSDYAPASWVMHNTYTYEVKICWIALAGYVWDNTQGFRNVHYVWQ